MVRLSHLLVFFISILTYSIDSDAQFVCCAITNRATIEISTDSGNACSGYKYGNDGLISYEIWYDISNDINKDNPHRACLNLFNRTNGTCCIKDSTNKVHCKFGRLGSSCAPGVGTVFEPNSQSCTDRQVPCNSVTPQPLNIHETTVNYPDSAVYNEAANSVELRWRIPTDNKNIIFQIQRSRNGNNFKPIGILESNNSASNTGNYNYIDNYPYTEGYYRIEYMQRGTLYALPVVSVIALKSGKMLLAFNQSTHHLRLLLGGMDNNHMQLGIYDMNGRQVFSQKISKGQYPEIDLSTLATGSFIVRAVQNGHAYVEKFFKQ